MAYDTQSILNNSNAFDDTTRRDFTLYATQFLNADKSAIFSEICQSIFVDYQTACLSGNSFEDVVSQFKDTASNGVQIFRRTFDNQRRNDDRIEAVMKSLEVERNVFDLILKLYHAELIAQHKEDKENSSLLKQFFMENAEFRRLITLLHWSEEVAFEHPIGFSQLVRVFENINNIDHAFSHAAFQKKFAHLDSCFLNQLSTEDAKNLDRIKNVLFCLLRCGRSARLDELVEKTGLSSLKCFLYVRQALTNPEFTPLDHHSKLYGLAESRMYFKNTASHLLSLSDETITNTDRCIWATLSGNLSVLLEYAKNSDDILWSYVNAAVEHLIDEAVIMAHKIEDDDIGNDMKQQDHLPSTISSIFTEFSKSCDDVFYKIIGSLVANNFEAIVKLAHADVSGISTDPNKIRLYAHLILLIKYGNYTCDETKADEILLMYTQMLIALDMHSLVPFYMSKLNKEKSMKEMIDFLYDINGESLRIEVLKAAAQVQFDVGKLCVEVYAKAKRENPLENGQKLSDSIAQLLNTWKFLLIAPEATSCEALIECNNLLRELFERDRYAEAMELLAMAPQKLTVETSEYIENLAKTSENESLKRRIQDQQREYNSYLLYLEIMEKFSLWQHRINVEIPERPKKLSDTEYAKLDLLQRAEYEKKMKQALNKISSHLQHCEQYQNVVIEQILNLVKQTSTWFACCLDISDVENIEEHQIRVAQLNRIHERYLYYTITMLITLYRDSHKDQEVLNVSNLIMDSRYDLYTHLSKESLSKIMAEISKSGYTLAVNADE